MQYFQRKQHETGKYSKEGRDIIASGDLLKQHIKGFKGNDTSEDVKKTRGYRVSFEGTKGNEC